MIASFHEEVYSICICGLAMPSSATRKPKYQFHQIYHFLKDIYDILWKIFRYDIFVRVGCVGSRSNERSEQVRFLIQTHERKILSYKIFPYQRKKYFQVNSQNRPVANLPVFNFRSQPQKMSLSNHWMSKFRFFLFEFWFSSPSRKFISWKTDVSAAEWRYQIQAKNYRIFSRALLWLFSGPKIFLQHRSLIW